MPDRTPADLIAQCDAITEGVTPGPWFVDEWSEVVVERAEGETYQIALGTEETDARFIAEARTLVPAMRDALAQAEEARAQAVADVRTLLEIIVDDRGTYLYCIACGNAWDHHSVAPHGRDCPIPNIRARYQEDAGE